MEPRQFADGKSLDTFLGELSVSPEARRSAIVDLETEGNSTIPRIALSEAELQAYWPIQFRRPG